LPTREASFIQSISILIMDTIERIVAIARNI
jgi:hypothetical protein